MRRLVGGEHLGIADNELYGAGETAPLGIKLLAPLCYPGGHICNAVFLVNRYYDYQFSHIEGCTVNVSPDPDGYEPCGWHPDNNPE